MNFWETKTLPEMTTQEWESLCDGCAKCCLHKLEDEDTGNIYFTSIACRLIDLTSCRCTRYAERTQIIPDCLDLRQLDTAQYYWLPATCAYRLVHEGKELPVWHPLVSKSTTSVEVSGISIRSYARKALESDNVDDFEDFIIEWLEE
ncbi:MAG: YcgN family cysteine cluster protein [Methylococcales bacterium]|nr:YcgN family cysteine cluster protein [Methylococcales bacterium]